MSGQVIRVPDDVLKNIEAEFDPHKRSDQITEATLKYLFEDQDLDLSRMLVSKKSDHVQHTLLTRACAQKPKYIKQIIKHAVAVGKLREYILARNSLGESPLTILLKYKSRNGPYPLINLEVLVEARIKLITEGVPLTAEELATLNSCNDNAHDQYPGVMDCVTGLLSCDRSHKERRTEAKKKRPSSAASPASSSTSAVELPAKHSRSASGLEALAAAAAATSAADTLLSKPIPQMTFRSKPPVVLATEAWLRHAPYRGRLLASIKDNLIDKGDTSGLSALEDFLKFYYQMCAGDDAALQYILLPAQLATLRTRILQLRVAIASNPALASFEQALVFIDQDIPRYITKLKATPYYSMMASQSAARQQLPGGSDSGSGSGSGLAPLIKP